jgi:hypothetical protein
VRSLWHSFQRALATVHWQGREFGAAGASTGSANVSATGVQVDRATVQKGRKKAKGTRKGRFFCCSFFFPPTRNRGTPAVAGGPPQWCAQHVTASGICAPAVVPVDHACDSLPVAVWTLWNWKPEGAKVFPLSVALQTTATGTPPNDGWVSDPTRSPTATGIAHGQW